MAHFKSVLFETEEIDPTAPLDCDILRDLARRLEVYTELPRAYLLLSPTDSLKNRLITQNARRVPPRSHVLRLV